MIRSINREDKYEASLEYSNMFQIQKCNLSINFCYNVLVKQTCYTTKVLYEQIYPSCFVQTKHASYGSTFSMIKGSHGFRPHLGH